MTFWSNQKMRDQLGTLIDDPDPGCLIDGAAYMLKVGSEYYVSPTELDADRNKKSLKTLSAGECFVIPPGQFAVLLTKEMVTIPKKALGFFSIRSRVKWKGLVNVSGFHIDPGFCGRLQIAVFNAGPAPIHLRQGEPEFLIWIADLDSSAREEDARKKPPVTKIDVNVLNQAPGENASLQGLSERIRKLERINYVVGLVAAAMLTFMITQAGSWLLASPLSPAHKTPHAPSEAPAKQQP